MSIFQHFLASAVVSSFGFFKEKSLPLPHPCLTPASGLTSAHPHAPRDSLPFSSRNYWKREKQWKGESCLLRTGEFWCFFPPLLLRVACRCGELCRVSFLPSFSPLKSISPPHPPAVLEGSPAFPPLPVHSGALTAQDQGPWSNFPLASSLL